MDKGDTQVMEQTHITEDEGYVFVTLKMSKEEYETLMLEAIEEMNDGTTEDEVNNEQE